MLQIFVTETTGIRVGELLVAAEVGGPQEGRNYPICAARLCLRLGDF